ncbi:hypothetical protein ACGFNU_09025 [Spirillospora sp. NPDC048911]|uniref:hypothetical protein n=1 Tax=Spirillospora sp. NPDC048911 TaxID=3364527 RepID=UPI00371D3DCF
MTVRRRMLVVLALTFFCLAGAPAAGADCVDLRGAAGALIDRSALCRNLRHELTEKHPDLGRALRRSVRGGRHAAPRRKISRPVRRLTAATRHRPKRPERASKPPQRVPKAAKATRRAVTPAPAAAIATPRAAVPAEASESLPSAAFPSIVAVALLLLAFAFHQRLTRPVPVPALRVSPVHPEPAPPPTALSTAERLARPAGLGVTGPGANGFVRAVLVELLTRGAKVVISRNELNRLFEGGFDEPLREALAPCLHVCELLEEAIEHLELDQLMAEAEQANPDLSPTGGRGRATYWISTPGRDDDVVLPLVRRGNLVGLMFGEWPHGTTCTVDSTGTITRIGTGEAPPLSPPGLGVAEALARLRTCTGWF